MNGYLCWTLYIGLAVLIHVSALSQPIHPMRISHAPMQVPDCGFTDRQLLKPRVEDHRWKNHLSPEANDMGNKVKLREKLSKMSAEQRKKFLVEYAEKLSTNAAEADQLPEGFSSWQWLNPLPQGNDLDGIHMFDANTAIAIGDGGTIIRTTNGGNNWSVRHRIVGTSAYLKGLSFPSDRLGFAVGWDALLKTTDAGINWNSKKISVAGWLNGCQFIDSLTGTVVGLDGQIYRTTDGGENWIRQSCDIPDTLYDTINSLEDVFFINKDTGIVVGCYTWGDNSANDKALILRTTNGGETWSVNIIETVWDLLDVAFFNADVGIAVGWMGTVLRTSDGGISWVSIDPIFTNWFEGISIKDDSTAFIYGSYGDIIYSVDKGQNWRRVQQSGTENYDGVNSMHFANDSIGACVGNAGVITRTTDGGMSWFRQSHGETSDLVASAFVDRNTGWIVGSYKQILRTTDGGSNWIDQHVDEFGFSTAIAISGRDTLIELDDFGVSCSYDHGNTWSDRNVISSRWLQKLAFLSPSVCLAVGDSGAIYRTLDAGQNWSQQVSPTSYALRAVSSVDSNTAVAVGGSPGCWGCASIIIRTTDKGSTWNTVYGSPYFDFRDVDFTSGGIGYATGGNFSQGRIYKSMDGGATWFLQASGKDYITGVAAANPQLAIAISGFGILCTKDGGASWNRWPVPSSTDLWDVALVKSGDGWMGYAVGFNGTILCAAISPLSPKIWTWTGSYDSSWTNPSNWTPAGTPIPGDSVVIPPATHSPIIDSIQQQVVIASLNILSGGKLTITDALPRFVVLGDVTVHGTLEVQPPAQTTIIVGGNWTVQPGGFDQRYASLARFKPALASDAGFIPYHSTVLFSGNGTMAGNFYNLMFDSASVMQSGGNIMIDNQCTAIGDVRLRAIDTVAFTSPEPQALVGSGKFLNGSVRRTLGKGVTEPYSFESPLTSLRFDESGTSPASVTMTVYPDTNPSGFGDRWEVVPSRIDTVFNTISADSLTHFTTWAIGTPRPRVTLLKSLLGTASDTIPIIRRVYRITAQGADSAGFVARLSLRYDQSEVPEGVGEDSLVLLRSDFVDGVKDHNSLSSYVPKEYRLEQNYPNPFNPGTTIRFEIPVSAFVTLKVYNLLGQEVATLVNGKREAGSHKVEFSAEGLPSGVYFCQLQANSFVQTRKFLVMR